VDDRATPNGILFVPRGGMPWRMPSMELGYGSAATCRRRLRGA
jgi:transposase